MQLNKTFEEKKQDDTAKETEMNEIHGTQFFEAGGRKVWIA